MQPFNCDEQLYRPSKGPMGKFAPFLAATSDCMDPKSPSGQRVPVLNALQIGSSRVITMQAYCRERRPLVSYRITEVEAVLQHVMPNNQLPATGQKVAACMHAEMDF